MKTNRLTGRRLMVSAFAAVLMLFFAGTVITACKKDTIEPHIQLKGSHSLADEGDGSYSVADYQAALDDVEVVSGKLKFVNSEHFIVTGMVLDSLGDSLTQIWYDNIGFGNSLYNEYNGVLSNMPDGQQDEIEGYFANHTNEVVFNATDETWDINAGCGTVARLVNADHKCLIGDNIFYTEYGVDVMVAATDEASIPTYAAMTDDYADEYAVVTHNNISAAKTTGTLCSGIGNKIFVGQISCGSPLKKRAEVRFSTYIFRNPFASSYTLGVVDVLNQKRGIFGRWVNEARGTHVSCYTPPFGTYFGQYRNNNAAHQSFAVGMLSGKKTYCITDLMVCVSPMCNGGTLCQVW